MSKCHLVNFSTEHVARKEDINFFGEKSPLYKEEAVASKRLVKNIFVSAGIKSKTKFNLALHSQIFMFFMFFNSLSSCGSFCLSLRDVFVILLQYVKLVSDFSPVLSSASDWSYLKGTHCFVFYIFPTEKRFR